MTLYFDHTNAELNFTRNDMRPSPIRNPLTAINYFTILLYIYNAYINDNKCVICNTTYYTDIRVKEIEIKIEMEIERIDYYFCS